MKKIIRPGIKESISYIIKCKECRCLFTYEEDDIFQKLYYDYNIEDVVSCPFCEEHVIIHRKKKYKNKKS